MALEVKHDNSLMLMFLNISYMVLITCKKCGDQLYLPDPYGDVTDFDVTCTASCRAVNVVTTKGGKIKGQYLRDI
ncbi:MAG: hypothetical protein WAM27_11170 [Nitrososphaeraceae archaeon]